MRVLIVGLLVLALSVAGISTYLIQRFSTPQAIEELEKKAAPVKYQVLVASRTLRPGDKIDNGGMSWEAWPDKPANDKYVVVENDGRRAEKVKKLSNMVVRQFIAQGEPILEEKLFKRDEPGFMAGQLAKGMRAVAISAAPQTAVAGFILPGDRVDVLLVHTKAQEARQEGPDRELERRGGQREEKPLEVLSTTTETILRNILVLAVDQIVDSPDGKPQTVRTITVQVTPKEAEILTTARAMGTLSLTLRDIASNSEGSSPTTYTTDVDVSAFLRGINRKRANEAKKNEAARQKARETAAQERAAQQKPTPAPVPKGGAQSKPKPEPEDVVIIYRGKSAETQEIKIK